MRNQVEDELCNEDVDNKQLILITKQLIRLSIINRLKEMYMEWSEIPSADTMIKS